MIRLTAERAQRLWGAPLSQQQDHQLEWRPSRWDGAGQAKWPPETAIGGRLIAWRVGRGKSLQWLYLFTTLTISAAAVVALYGKRWNVETDLRSLKQTVRLQRLAVQSVDMMEKELWAAILAYNLVRAVMTLAARKAKLHPRQLSFTYAYNIVQYGIGDVLSGPTTVEQIARMERIIKLVARCKLPRRTEHRSFPRLVWGRGATYPHREKTK